MVAILYLILCLIFGLSLVKVAVPNTARLFTACSPSKKIASKVPSLVFEIPAGFIVGLTSVAFVNYIVTYLLSLGIREANLCKRLSVLITFAIFSILAASNFMIFLKNRKKTLESSASSIPEYKNSVSSIFIYGIPTIIFTLVATFLMFYSYNLSNGELLAGYSTFSDMAPHTAMTSSFGVGFNFPTQYMHYSGDGIKYHFLFYYLCGTLQYLGLPIDWAINLPSIISMVCCFELLGLLSVLLTRKRATFVIAPILVLFRSSLNVFHHIHDLRTLGIPLKSAIESIIHSAQWYGVTPYDNWGIWAINVYPNQRHLLLGMSAILLFIILLVPFMRRMCINVIKQETIGNKFKVFFLSSEAYIWRKNDPINPLGIMILTSILAIVMPFFHGSALIGGLLVLFFMALFSESRLIYLTVAISAVVSSFIQTHLFAGGASNVVNFQHVPGFVLTQTLPYGYTNTEYMKSLTNYLVTVTGLTLILAIVYAIYLLIRDIIKNKPIYRSLLLIGFLFPLIFAFNFQVSLEMLANHKFIQFTLILADIYVAGALAELFSLPIKHKSSKYTDKENEGKISLPIYVVCQTFAVIVALVLIVPLVATGASEWCTYININRNHSIVNTKSEVTLWINENTDPQDVFLTPYTWSLNRFYLSGRPSYYGWPYYAWSAGHDTYTREKVYYWLISGCGGDINAFREYCQSRGIKYLIDDPDFEYIASDSGVTFNSEFFVQNLTPVAYFSNENTIIYEIY